MMIPLTHIISVYEHPDKPMSMKIVEDSSYSCVNVTDVVSRHYTKRNLPYQIDVIVSSGTGTSRTEESSAYVYRLYIINSSPVSVPLDLTVTELFDTINKMYEITITRWIYPISSHNTRGVLEPSDGIVPDDMDNITMLYYDPKIQHVNPELLVNENITGNPQRRLHIHHITKVAIEVSNKISIYTKYRSYYIKFKYWLSTTRQIQIIRKSMKKWRHQLLCKSLDHDVVDYILELETR